MKKRIVVGLFHDGYTPIFVGGRKNVNREKRNEEVVFVGEKRLTVEVPGCILGTPEEWNVMFENSLEKSWNRISM